MQEHGTGSFGVLVTWKNGRQTKLWSPTESEREADFRLHGRMPDVKSVTRVKR
jgi:hypothetical protein